MKTAKCPTCSGCARLIDEDYVCSRCGEAWTAPVSRVVVAPPAKVETKLHVVATAAPAAAVTVRCAAGTLEAQREASKRWYPTHAERSGWVGQTRIEHDCSEVERDLSGAAYYDW